MKIRKLSNGKILGFPTTQEEEIYLECSKDKNGNYRPWVYEFLYAYKDAIIDNIFHDNPEMDFVNYENIKQLRKNDNEWNVKSITPIPKLSDLCILGLYHYRKLEQLNSVYDDMVYDDEEIDREADI
jgi:hypothetical protein